MKSVGRLSRTAYSHRAQPLYTGGREGWVYPPWQVLSEEESNVLTVLLCGAEDQTGVLWDHLHHQRQQVVLV